MRYPLKEQETLENTVALGYDLIELEKQRALAYEERQLAIKEWDKSNKKKEEENSTFEELSEYLRLHAFIDTSPQDYSFQRTYLERIGCNIITFYKVYKKSKLPFNIDRILFRYMLSKGIATDLEIFQMMSRT